MSLIIAYLSYLRIQGFWWLLVCKTFVYNPLNFFVFRSDFDPRVTNEFAAGGFRVGHTLIPDILKTFDAITSRAKKEIDVEDAFADSDILREPGFVDELVKGMNISSRV